MSGDDLGGALRDPVTYPNWMWVVGTILAVLALAWVAAVLWRWWRSEETDIPELVTISEAERRRYLGLIDQIARRRDDGDLDGRGVHLAIAGLMRALGTVRTGRDLEVATVSEIATLAPTWPELAAVLRECEQPSFRGGPGGSGVATPGDEGGPASRGAHTDADEPGHSDGGAGGALVDERPTTAAAADARPGERALGLAREAVES